LENPQAIAHFLTDGFAEFMNFELNPLLSGNIPAEFGNLARMTSLAVYQTNINGSVPLEVCALTDVNLTMISVDCDLACSCCGDFCF
jgi:hypothetical protein